MATTTFSGPVVSNNGFVGNVAGAVVATSITAVGAVSLTNAVISMPNLPTSDPAVAGQLWNNSGVLTVSAG